MQTGLAKILQDVGDGIAPAFWPRAADLHHQHVAVAVDDHSGQAVGFGMDQAHAVAVVSEISARCAPPMRAGQSACEKISVVDFSASLNDQTRAVICESGL